MSRLLVRPWFWVLLVAALWLAPLLKSLGADYPDPVPGHEREPASFRLTTLDGGSIRLSDLAGHLVIVETLDFGAAGDPEGAFVAMRERKKRWRGLGSLVVYAILARATDIPELGSFVHARKARKPSNVFLLDPAGATWNELTQAAGDPSATALVLDRHGRLRGAYGDSPEELDRMAQDLASLANWVGSDPPPGAPVTR